MKFKVFVQQWVEEIAEVEVEADTVEEAIEKAEEMARDSEIDDWSDGTDIIVGAAAEAGGPAYAARDEDGELAWERG